LKLENICYVDIWSKEQGLALTGMQQHLVYSDGNLLGKSMKTAKKNIEFY
jgi:hypothetical protein